MVECKNSGFVLSFLQREGAEVMVNLNQTGKFIAECRKKKQLTQKQLGEKLHLTDRAVSKWENGKAFPDVHIMEDLCRELDISVSELLAGKRIETEQYQKETEKLLMTAVGRSQLYGFQIIIYILMFSFITAFQLLLVLKGDGEWLPPTREMILCGLVCVGTFACAVYLDKKIPERMFRMSSPVIQGIVGGVYFLLLTLFDYQSYGGLEGMESGEQIFLILFFIVGFVFTVFFWAAAGSERKDK